VVEIDAARQRIRPPRPRDAVAELRCQYDLNRLATMTPERRKEALTKAVTNRRDQIIAAVLSDDLSEMAESDRAMLAFEWAQRHHPDDPSMIERYEKALHDAMRIASLSDQFITGLTDNELIAHGESAERAAKEAAKAS
jgi:hypothetical protein